MVERGPVYSYKATCLYYSSGLCLGVSCLYSLLGQSVNIDITEWDLTQASKLSRTVKLVATSVIISDHLKSLLGN